MALKLAAGPQIVPLYGTTFRSTPVYFLQDDHDHWENDSPLTYPVPWFQLQLARTTQQLYYPEFLPMQIALSVYPIPQTQNAASFPRALALRYGDLLEVLLYDVRRTLNVGDLTRCFWIEPLKTGSPSGPPQQTHGI